MTTIERGTLTRDLQQKIRGQMPDVIADLRAKATEHATEAPRREAGFSVQNATGDEAVVRIYDEIWWLGVNAMDLTAELDAITAPKIRVEINSPGGDVFDGIAIYNALRLHPAEITTRVDGIAASIASVIAQAGDHRVMVASSQMMIHNAWGLTVGDYADHEEMASLLEMQDEIIAGIYATKATNGADHFRALMNAETWMTAERAVAEGLADEVLEPPVAPSASLAEKITALAQSDVIDDVERLVAAHGDEGLTGTKRDGLVALRARLDGLLNDGTEAVEHPDVVAARLANAKRSTTFQAGLPPQFLG